MKSKLSRETVKLLIRGAYLKQYTGGCNHCPMLTNEGAQVIHDEFGGARFSICTVGRMKLNYCLCEELVGFVIATSIEKDLKL
jgi:hypothetical protein